MNIYWARGTFDFNTWHARWWWWGFVQGSDIPSHLVCQNQMPIALSLSERHVSIEAANWKIEFLFNRLHTSQTNVLNQAYNWKIWAIFLRSLVGFESICGI